MTFFRRKLTNLLYYNVNFVNNISNIIYGNNKVSEGVEKKVRWIFSFLGNNKNFEEDKFLEFSVNAKYF
jgi:hypothetical protein